MREAILEDAKTHPQLFHWRGPVEPEPLQRWLNERRLDLPPGLIEFWKVTGGGDFFESETILGPLADASLADDADSVNEYHWSQGLPRTLFIFHTGNKLTAVDQKTGSVVVLNEKNYQQEAVYPSLSAWYERAIRAEYADRYGLKQAA